ncbi:hypothetical protein DVA67_030490 [Solirubrobacter sp. CPCC 204708]|nr:hypothetical protein [Solirubrobacter deserti]
MTAFDEFHAELARRHRVAGRALAAVGDRDDRDDRAWARRSSDGDRRAVRRSQVYAFSTVG